MPRWVWVLPTSIARSMRARSKHADPLDALTLEAVEGVGEPRAVGQGERGIELQKRHEHEAPGQDVAVRQHQALAGERQIPQEQEVNVNNAGTVTNLSEVPPQLGLNLLYQPQ